MRVFTIENETNKIMVHASVEQAGAVANAKQFRSETALARLAADWPLSRLVDIWNNLRGVKLVARFKDRPTAVSRIWKATQNGDSVRDLTNEGSAKATNTGGEPRDGTKANRVLAMLRREGGATVDEIVSVTGWQKHTARAMVSAGGSLTKRYGIVITSQKMADQRRYCVKT